MQSHYKEFLADIQRKKGHYKHITEQVCLALKKCSKTKQNRYQNFNFIHADFC